MLGNSSGTSEFPLLLLRSPSRRCFPAWGRLNCGRLLRRAPRCCLNILADR